MIRHFSENITPKDFLKSFYSNRLNYGGLVYEKNYGFQVVRFVIKSVSLNQENDEFYSSIGFHSTANNAYASSVWVYLTDILEIEEFLECEYSDLNDLVSRVVIYKFHLMNNDVYELVGNWKQK